MQKKSILLPHACHKVGWWLLLLIPLVVGFYEILYYFFRETPMFAVVNNNSRFITMVCYLVVIAAAFLICLSKEKVEDEMVAQYRLRAIGISAYVNFLLFLGFCCSVRWTMDSASVTGNRGGESFTGRCRCSSA